MKKTTAILLCILLCLSTIVLIAEATGGDNVLTVYPEYDKRITRCYDYDVSVTQGTKTEKLVVYNRSDSMELLSGRTNSADNERRFCEFAFQGDEVRIDIAVHSDFSTYSVIPSSAAYRTECNNGVISVWVKENNKTLSIRLNDDDDTILSIFADAPEEYEIDYNDPSVLVFDEKWTDPINGNPTFKVKGDIKKIYIAPGCVLNSRLYIASDNFELCGHGILLDPYSNLFDYDNESSGKLVIVDAKNTTIRDIKMLDSQNFNLCYYYYAENNTAENLKILSARMCTDGISNYSGINTIINNCYIYVGDNALVFSSGRYGTNDGRFSLQVNNCILGTTCAALFPQGDMKAPVRLKNTIIFRADEGIMNFWHNPSALNQKAEMIEVDGLDCIDCINTPWLLNIKHAGNAEKNIVFRNVTLGPIRGSSHIADEMNGNAVIIQPMSSSNQITDNLSVGFTNVYIDGNLIINEETLGTSVPEGLSDISFSFNETENELLTQRTIYTADYKYPAKVYIGASFQEMETQPVFVNSEWYLPSEETAQKLCLGYDNTVLLSEINGIEMISLSALNSLTNAVYDSEKKAIEIDAIKDTERNLFTDNTATDGYSRFQELTCYNTEAGTVYENDDLCYKITVKDATSAGAIIDITNEIMSYPGETFVIEFDAKSNNNSDNNCTFAFGKNNSHSGNQLSTNYFTFGSSWKHYEIKCYTNSVDFNTCDLFYIFFRNNGTSDFEVLLKNISVKLFSDESSSNLIVNGGFESERVPAGEWKYEFTEPTGWKSTDNNTIEIGNDYWKYYIGIDYPKFYPEGTQFAEVCASKESTLYQILPTDACAEYEWGLSHVGRGDYDNTMMLVMCDASSLSSYNIKLMKNWLKTQEEIETPAVSEVKQYCVFCNSGLDNFSFTKTDECNIRVSVWLMTSNHNAWVNYGTNSPAYNTGTSDEYCIDSYSTKYSTAATETETFFAMTNYIVKWSATGNIIDDIHVEKTGDRVPAADRLYMTAATNKTTHQLVIIPATKASCSEYGLTAGEKCSVCGKETIEQQLIEKTGHISDNGTITQPPSCIENGIITYSCTVCSAVLKEEITEKTDHIDNDNDYYCDYCSKALSTGETEATKCTCNCHKSGFSGFIWKILRFFYKLFGKNQYCSCGEAHY